MRKIRMLVENTKAQVELGNKYRDGNGKEQDYEEAMFWYKKAADKGDADAQKELADMYANGLGVEQDYIRAGFWYKKSADQGNAEAQNLLGVMYENGRGINNDYAEAIKLYEKSAVQGNQWGQKNLADKYFNGIGIDRDYKKAAYWYEKSAEQGNAGAQNSLGVIYENGLGVEKYYKKAVELYRKSAEQGYHWGQFNLGVMYSDGKGTDQDYGKAAYWYEKSAEQGNRYAQNNLGVMYETGRGVEKDYTKAVELYRKSAEQGYQWAQKNLANNYYSGIGVERDYSKAAYWFKKSADQGNSNAQNMLGVMYDNGRGVERDSVKAIEIFKKSAEQGYHWGQFNLGNMYRDGRGANRDYSKAAYWFKKSADQGNSNAQNMLGVMYDTGRGVERDSVKAIELFKKSAEQGYHWGQFNLGDMYGDGRGTNQDYSKAAYWYGKAAEQGNAEAQNRLGVLYSDGKGVEKDHTKAVELYRKSAEQGCHWGQYNLGNMYYNGIGIEQDYKKAVYWFEKSAEQGNSDAQNDLGDMFYYGEGVNQDYFKAVELYRKSAEQGNAEAKYNLGQMYFYGNGVEKNQDLAIEYLKKAAEQGFEEAKVILDELSRNTISEKTSDDADHDPDNEEKTVEDILDELDKMVGLTSVKEQVRKRVNQIRVEENAKKAGSSRDFSTLSRHMLFYGNPGTGKTTVARTVGQIYGKLGVISNPDVFVECSREDLVSAFIGGTEEKTKKVIEKAKGGILFIDEAYSLYKPDSSEDFGKVAIDLLVQYMENMRDELIVIMAGYRNEMQRMIKHANPGLRSRFRIVIDFQDYNQEELKQILLNMISAEKMILDDNAGKLTAQLIRKRSKRPDFGNARGIRNLFEDIKEAQMNRLAEKSENGEEIKVEEYEIINEDDIKSVLSENDGTGIDVDELLKELDAMIGLESVKKQINIQVAKVRVQAERRKKGAKINNEIGSNHMIFSGNPGTGKTTVARLLAKIYEGLNLISDSNVFVECSRADLVAGYVGQTAVKTKAKIEEAIGGILFIDEAYSLFGEHERDFGTEAIDTLVSEMENHRDDLIVIMAGYTDKMKNMIDNANPGLKSRFTNWIEFEDYSIPEMIMIYKSMLGDYSLEEGIEEQLELLIREKSQKPDFGNARGIRNLVGHTLDALDVRLDSVSKEALSAHDLMTVTSEDIEKVRISNPM